MSRSVESDERALNRDSDDAVRASGSDRPFFRPAPYPGAADRTEAITLPGSPQVESTPAFASSRALMRTLIANWPVVVPLLLLTAAAMVVPTMTNVSTTDDWAYTRAVEILLDEGRLTMFPVVAATAVGQVLWAALFGLVFGMELWVMRLSTIVMVGLGAIGLFAILRQVGVSRDRAALGMALYLFNPLTFILAFSFMTDPHFASVMLLSLAFYVFGLHPDRPRGWSIVTAAVLAGFAFWIRQQGALIPFSVVLYLLATRRVSISWSSAVRLLQAAAAPAIMLISYYAWLYWVNDVPSVQEGFLDRALSYGWDGTWYLTRYLTYFEMAYLGFFLLPLTLAIAPGIRGKRSPLFGSSIGYWAFLGWTVAAIAGLYVVTSQGRQMPYIGQFLGAGGFGPGDVPGPRKRIVEWLQFWDLLTIAAVGGAVLLGLVLCRRLGDAPSPERAAAGLVAMVGLWQVIGIMPPSYQYITRGGSLDRYLLPIIPVAIVLALWSLRDTPILRPLAWALIGVFAMVSTVATRDYLVYMDAVWDMAEWANGRGVANEQMDAGSGWDGYHLYTDMLDRGIWRNESPSGSPWWINFYAKQTDSTYIVSTTTTWREGYEVVAWREYDQWLEEDAVTVYLLRKNDAPWPPEP